VKYKNVEHTSLCLDALCDRLNFWLEVHLARGEVFPGDGVGLATAMRMAMAAALNHPTLP
jgi:hypothetical protein